MQCIKLCIGGVFFFVVCTIHTFTFCAIHPIVFAILKKEETKKIGFSLRNRNLRIHLMNLSVGNKQLYHAPALGKCTLELN